MEDNKEVKNIEIKRASNGWILEIKPMMCNVLAIEDVSVFNYMEDLAEYLKTIDDK